MKNLAGWLAILAAVVGVLNQMVWLSADTWYAGWIAVVLAAIAGVTALISD